MQVKALMFDTPPKSLYEDVINESSFTINIKLYAMQL